MNTDAKIERIAELYDAGAPLVTIVREVGTDDASLRLVHSRLGTAMSTLRRVAAELDAEAPLTPAEADALAHVDTTKDGWLTEYEARLAKPTPEALLHELRAWFAGEVEAGDEALRVWVDRIDATLRP